MPILTSNVPGKVVNISAVLDPATRTAKVRIELPNPQGIMRPGMFVTATFKARTNGRANRYSFDRCGPSAR